MTSLGVSPTTPSLLFPPNPSFAHPDNAPRGGILINARRESGGISQPSSPLVKPTLLDTSTKTLSSVFGSPAKAKKTSEAGSPPSPVSPIADINTSVTSPGGSSTFRLSIPGPGSSNGDAGDDHRSNASVTSPGLHSARIRFAPLPDPRRPRSLSTGRNIGFKTEETEDGGVRRAIEIRNHHVEYESDDEPAADNDDVAVEDEEEGTDDEARRSRRWSKSMGMGSTWKGTKKGTLKLLGMKDEKEGYTEGAPLKKSASTGGFTASSPFKWSSEQESRKTLSASLSSSSSSKVDSHRRNSSLDPSSASSATATLSSSPQPVKMLNGRVYGSRRASEAAEREKQLRQQDEPEFVEWGFGKASTSLGSVSSAASGAKAKTAATEPSSGKGFLGDAEDGSGMEWVKRRREERERKKREEQEAAAAAAAASRSGGVNFASGPGSSSSVSTPAASPNFESTSRHARSDSGASEISNMAISLSPETTTSSTKLVTPPTNNNAPLPPTPIIQVSEHYSPMTNGSAMGAGLSKTISAPDMPFKSKDQHDLQSHVTKAIQVPSGAGRQVNQDTFDDNDEAVADSEDSEEDDEDDDGDFEDDEEEENDVRTTSSAAGIEVVSRHK